MLTRNICSTTINNAHMGSAWTVLSQSVQLLPRLLKTQKPLSCRGLSTLSSNAEMRHDVHTYMSG